MTAQRVVFPWESKDWNHKKEKITQPISSIGDFDARVASLQRKLKPRQLSDSLTTYFGETKVTSVTERELVDNLIPMMQKLILSGNKVFKKFNSNILAVGKTANIVLTRTQVCIIMSCMMFGLFSSWLSNGKKRPKNKPSPAGILTEDDFQVPSFMHAVTANNKLFYNSVFAYFKYIHSIWSISPAELDKRIIIYKRHYNTAPLDLNSELSLCDVKMVEGGIDSHDCKFQVAFSHDIIGGERWFGSILTQEDVLMLSRPELIPIVLFCPAQVDEEVILGLGAERINEFSGYGTSIQWKSLYNETLPIKTVGKESIVQNTVIFMDASSKTGMRAICVTSFVRDMYKAFTGFSAINLPGSIVTGNWINQFSGNIYVRFIQQLVAASLCGKSLLYCAPNKDIEQEISQFIEWLNINEIKIRKLLTLYKTVLSEAIEDDSTRLSDLNIFNEIMEIE